MSFQPSKNGLSALPLASLPALVLDTETTGLDTLNDRIIEIAAVRIRNGERCDDSISEFIAPGIPVPAKSTAIHGIRDADLVGADPFAEVFARFAAWAGTDVVIGYSLGFDLTMLGNEHQRAGLSWSAPRCLDVRHLMQVVAPDLPGQNLEIAAGWLGIEVTERHRALGDARVTADIFHALIPKLRQRGIVTLAQAERACRALSSHLNAEAQAGWHPVLNDDASATDTAVLARIDSFPYRHRVAELMHSPPVTISADLALRKSLALMIEKRISSVFVAPDGADVPWGILTERDVLRAVDTDGAAALDHDSGDYAIRPLVSIAENEFVYRAITRMASGNFRHLGVTDEAGNITGALSARDLLKQRAGDAMSLGDTIDAAGSPAELGSIWESLTMVVRALSHEAVDPRNIAAIISHELRALTRRATELAEQQMQAEGFGPAPMPYAMLVLGSGGRGESLLAMDQDNAIVYQQGERGDAADQWFERLGTIAADTLDGVGVCYCKGGIMAKNPEWRMDVRHWKQTVEQWINKARPEDILNSDIFFDATAVHGDTALGEALRTDAIRVASDNRQFLQHMAVKAADFDSPVGWFGRIKSEAGRLDLKKCGIMPIVSTARVLSLQLGLAARSTAERLAEAKAHDIAGAHLIDGLIEAHRIMLGAILRQQLRDIETGIPLSNKVELAALDSHEKQELGWALERSPGINDLLGTPTRF